MAEDVSTVGVVRGRPRDVGRRRRRCSGRSNTRLSTYTPPNSSEGSPQHPSPGTYLTASMSTRRRCFSRSVHRRSLCGRGRQGRSSWVPACYSLQCLERGSRRMSTRTGRCSTSSTTEAREEGAMRTGGWKTRILPVWQLPATIILHPDGHAVVLHPDQ